MLWGAAGLAVSAAAALFSGWHACGLLHFGPAPRDGWWISALEYLIIWLVPAAIFYALGAVLSRSRVRAIDVFGTTAFALLPLAVMNLAWLMPGTGEVLAVVKEPVFDIARFVEVTAQPIFIAHAVVTLAMLALMAVWLFNAVKVSCNLRSGRLWAVYLAGLAGGDVLCRMLIGMMF